MMSLRSASWVTIGSMGRLANRWKEKDWRSSWEKMRGLGSMPSFIFWRSVRGGGTVRPGTAGRRIGGRGIGEERRGEGVRGNRGGEGEGGRKRKEGVRDRKREG